MSIESVISHFGDILLPELNRIIAGFLCETITYKCHNETIVYFTFNGKKEGEYISMNNEGKIIFKSSYRNGVRHGPCYLLTYENGNLNGAYQTWYDNGNRKSAGYYVKGELQGRLYEWKHVDY